MIPEYRDGDDFSVVLRSIDIAKYIVDRIGTTDIWKLHKLIYYCQAWSLVWEKRPIMHERIEAWANGPVCPMLVELFNDYWEVGQMTPIWDGAYTNRNSNELVSIYDWETIEVVIDDYGNKEYFELEELTKLEEPWKQARNGVKSMEHCTNEITHEMMRDYYGSL